MAHEVRVIELISGLGDGMKQKECNIIPSYLVMLNNTLFFSVESQTFTECSLSLGWNFFIFFYVY